jgi:hypothetical protein
MIRILLSQHIKRLKLVLTSERGIALSEALVTMGITGIVTVAFLASMSATSKAVMVSEERVTSESLAKSQMEYIKSQVYNEENPPSYYELPTGDIPENYDIVISGNQVDDGLQKLTVIVTYDGVEAFHLESYRTRRE